MSESIPSTPEPFAATAIDSVPSPPKPLRWWPAVVLIGLMIFIRNLPAIAEPSMPVIMFAFMGPAAVALLLLVWWVAASRATWRERLVGAIAAVGICILACVIAHKSIQGMPIMLFMIPYGFSLFAIGLILFSYKPNLRLYTGILGALLGFGAWDLLQTPGVSGTFQTSFDWRWNKTSEERYLESISTKTDGKKSDEAASSGPAITLASSKWPAFRGASRDGKLFGVSLDDDWAKNPPKKIWLREIGPAWSSFVVAGKRLFTQEQQGEQEAILCLDADTGETIWEHLNEGRFWEGLAGAGPRATPTLADEGLFALGANGVLTCVNASTGKEIWHRELQKDASRIPPSWGFSSSPLVVSGLVIVHAGGKDDKGILAYDAKTGEPRWSAPSGDHSYSSPQLATIDGVSGILMETNKGLQFVDPTSGESIWQHDFPTETYRTLQPLVLGNSIFIGTPLGNGTRRITAKLDSNEWSVKEDWTSRDMKPDFNDFVEYQGCLYGFDKDIFACIGLEDGKRKWKKGRYGCGQVIMLCDAGQMLITSEKGELVLLQADPTKMIELAKFQAIEGKTWNHSVLVGNRIYIRNAEQAACYELPTK